MAFQSATRFGYSITLPFSGSRKYTIQSPPVDVGNFMIESTQLSGQRVALSMELMKLLKEQQDLPEDADEKTRVDLDGRIVDVSNAMNALTEKLTIPDEMEADYFRAILGPAYDQMLENKEPFELVKLAASTVSVWVVSGRDDAESFWNNGGRPDRPQKAPQDRRTKRGPSSSTATSK